MNLDHIRHVAFLNELQKIAQIGNLNMPFKPMTQGKQPFQNFVNNTQSRPEIEPESSSLEEYEG